MNDQVPTVLSDADRLAFYKKAAQATDPDSHNFHGLRIHAAEGLHEAVGALAIASFAKGGQVLDVASGSGALCLRLKEAGFDMTGCDLVEENFRLKGQVRFQRLDLNTLFAATLDRQYDAVTATEIIEHLENPRQFLRQCFAALKPGGKLLLSTPNVDSALAKALYVTHGTQKWYTDHDYLTYGHITPVSLWVLGKALAEAGFTIDTVTSDGDYDGRFLGWWKMLTLAKLFKFLDRAATPQGDILIVLATKPA
jgi:SAM-dependent methyltransferase